MSWVYLMEQIGAADQLQNLATARVAQAEPKHVKEYLRKLENRIYGNFEQ